MNNGNFAHYFKHIVLVSAYLRPENVSILSKMLLYQILEKHLATKTAIKYFLETLKAKKALNFLT